MPQSCNPRRRLRLRLRLHSVGSAESDPNLGAIRHVCFFPDPYRHGRGNPGRTRTQAGWLPSHSARHAQQPRSWRTSHPASLLTAARKGADRANRGRRGAGRAGCSGARRRRCREDESTFLPICVASVERMPQRGPDRHDRLALPRPGAQIQIGTAVTGILIGQVQHATRGAEPGDPARNRSPPHQARVKLTAPDTRPA